MKMGLSSVTQTVLVTTVVTAVSILGTFLYKRWKLVKIPSKWEQVATLKKIHLYPLKSGHRLELQRAKVTITGICQTADDEKNFQMRDRVLVVYGAKDNEFRTARTYPKMTQIDVSVHDHEHLAIDAPTMRTLYVKIPNKEEHPVTSIKSWNSERIDGIDCGEEAASWFSRYIIERDTGLRLAYNDLSKRRDITKSHKKLLDYYKFLSNDSTGLFHDLSSVSLINQPSVTDLNKHIGNSLITAEHFRHNFVLDGSDLAPYAEDSWDWIKIGENVVLRNVKDCTRCAFTTINPENGVRDPKHEPLQTLKTYRGSLGPDKSPNIGLNLEVRRTGFVKVGDPVYIGKNEP